MGALSRRGKCRACADARVIEACTQISAHDGPWFDYWRRRGAASYGGVLLDDLRETA